MALMVTLYIRVHNFSD